MKDYFLKTYHQIIDLEKKRKKKLTEQLKTNTYFIKIDYLLIIKKIHIIFNEYKWIFSYLYTLKYGHIINKHTAFLRIGLGSSSLL